MKRATGIIQLTQKDMGHLRAHALKTQAAAPRAAARPPKTEGDSSKRLDFTLPLFKADDEKRIAYYWLSQVETKAGKLCRDAYGHIIREGVLEDTAHYFMKTSRVAAYRHMDKDGKRRSEGGGPAAPVGTVVGSWVTTRQWQQAIGLEAGALPVGWMVAVHVENEDVWQAIKRGDLPCMSLGGMGELREVEVDSDMLEAA